MEASCSDVNIPLENKSDEYNYSEDDEFESLDPLWEPNSHTPESQYYRMDSTVIAEPLSNNSNENLTNDLNEDEFIFKDNVTIQKRSGKKYKKYHISVEESPAFKCPQSNCTNTFSTAKLLKAHVGKVHCAEKDYMCERCGASFSAKYLLVRHSSVHTEKRVTCHICNKTLSMRTNLSAHLESHSGERTYSCEVCGKNFARASTLTTHIKFVHREGLLGCDQCDAKFSSRKEWSQHVASHRKTPAQDTSQDL